VKDLGTNIGRGLERGSVTGGNWNAAQKRRDWGFEPIL
jgi:hypothetical protein